MPSGACVIRRDGKRAVVWSVKYRDANGRQVKERLGPEPQWNEQRAERELGKRLDKVETERWSKPTRETFAAFAERFERDYLPTRRLKPSTAADYKTILANHLKPAFETFDLAAIDPSHVDAFIAAQSTSYSGKTIGNQLALLRLVFKVAVRWKLIGTNPVLAVDRPPVEQPETLILTEDEIAELLKAYTLLALEAEPEAGAALFALAKRATLVVLGTAIRRGELLALRWSDVDLLERKLHVRQAWVRGAMTTPKSRASRRVIHFGLKTAEAFEEQWRASRYRQDGDLVFGHPELGTPLDPAMLTREYVKPALKRAGIIKPLQPWHGLRHTALTMDAAVGNPNAYVQAKAGHSQFSVTERYVHAAQVAFPGAVELAEARMFGD